MTPRPKCLRRYGPLLASLAIHAGLLLLLARLAPPAPLPAPPRPIPVSLHLLPPAPRPAPPAQERVPAAPPRGSNSGRSASRPARPKAGGAPAAAPSAGGPAPGSEAWLRERGLEPGEGPAAPPLVTRLPAIPGGGEGAPAEPAPDPKRAIDELFGEMKAHYRASHEMDSYWSGVRGRLEQGFAPDWDVLQPERSEGLGVVPRVLGEIVRAWLPEAERYGRTGNPEDAGDAGAQPGTPPLDTVFVKELEVLVRVVQTAEGKVVRVELARSSGNRAYDRLAMARARALAEEPASRLGPPPAQGRETVWAFATVFERVPPLPIVGCAFDAHFRLTDCFYPLKTSARSRVELRSVR